MSLTARIQLDPEDTIGEIAPELFGGFVEHLGRCVYGGIYDPESPLADANGLRSDLRAALDDLRYSVIRYPGGNFVSGYRWQDGVGPAAERPRRRDAAWHSIESNRFGTNEFIGFCRTIGAQPMLGLNFGTGGIQDAADLVEYCNAPRGTKFADLRVAHGFREPHAVKYWCLGNEMDGWWQIGHMDAEAYGGKAREAARLMRAHDASIRLALCGSSGPGMPTYPEWDRRVLELAWEEVDYLSLHRYAENKADELSDYLSHTIEFEDQLDTLAALLRYMRARLHSKHEVRLSWDEWNVWYRRTEGDGGWTEAPHLLEEEYNLEDALVIALWLNVFLRRCDVLRVACLAQLVNVIAPILLDGDRLVRQTIFHPFHMFRRHARGVSLRPRVVSPRLSTKRYGEQPALDVSACREESTGQAAVFIVNRHPSESVRVDVEMAGMPLREVLAHHRLGGKDPKAANTFEHPDAVRPESVPGGPIRDGTLSVDLPPLSLTVLALK